MFLRQDLPGLASNSEQSCLESPNCWWAQPVFRGAGAADAVVGHRFCRSVCTHFLMLGVHFVSRLALSKFNHSLPKAYSLSHYNLIVASVVVASVSIYDC